MRKFLLCYDGELQHGIVVCLNVSEAAVWMPKTKLTKVRWMFLFLGLILKNQFTNLSCKLEIFDEILFSPVKLMNRLENTFLHTRKTIRGEVSFSALCTFSSAYSRRIQHWTAPPLVSWSLWWRMSSSDEHPVSLTTACCFYVSWVWDLLPCCCL